MKIGVRSLNINRDFEQALRFCAGLGIDGVQLSPDETGAYEATDGELRALKARIEDLGLEIASLNSGPNLVDPGQIPDSLRKFERILHAAAVLGAKSVTGETKWLGPGQNAEDGWRRAAEALKRIAAMAGREGVVFCLEPWPPNLVRTDDDLLRMLDAVGDARMRVNFDGGNLWGAGCDSVAAARRLAPLVGHVHVKDWDRSAAPETPMWQPGPGDGPKPPNPVRGEVVLGEGEVDWPEILRILRGAGYDGWLVVERNSSKTREDDARIAVARLKSMLQKA